MAVKEQRNTTTQSTAKKDTTSIISLRVGKQALRLPSFITSPLVMFIITILGIIIFYPYTLTVQRFNLPNVGDVSTETIIAPLNFNIIKSEDELRHDREIAKNQVLLVFGRSDAVTKDIHRVLLFLKTKVMDLAMVEIPDSLKKDIVTILKRDLSDKTITILTDRTYLLDDVILQTEEVMEAGVIDAILVDGEEEKKNLAEKYLQTTHLLNYDKAFVTVLQDSSEQSVNVKDLMLKQQALDYIIHSLKIDRMFDPDALSSVYELLDRFLKPNVLYDENETVSRRDIAASSVLTTKGKVIKDSEIIRKHQVVTNETVGKLKSLHVALDTKQHDEVTRRVLMANIGTIVLITFILLLVWIYISMYHSEVYSKPRHLAALATIIILQFVICRGGLLVLPRLFDSTVEIGSLAPKLLIPTAVASILTAILFSFRLSIIISIFTSICFGIMISFNHILVLYALSGALIGGYVTRHIRYRWDFFKALSPIIFAYAFCIIIWRVITANIEVLLLVQDVGIVIINGILTIFIVMMAVAAFENLFDITTDMTLVELSDMNNPLLKRLSIEAAGTYNHSVLVANLAESAAQRIGANPLLVRVAAYYHDIGKIAKPNYFVENQKMEKNVHDKLSPHMSALIISSHVKEGLVLAKDFKVPSVIQDAIRQHHGTSSVSFFYEKARELDQHDQVKEKDFSYPGPRPQTRENAIIMLADSVEAASRSISTSSPKMLRDLVKKIIHDKFRSSQLDECNLTFYDLDQIIEGFMPVLQGIFHTRIEYPNKN